MNFVSNSDKRHENRIHLHKQAIGSINTACRYSRRKLPLLWRTNAGLPKSYQQPEPHHASNLPQPRQHKQKLHVRVSISNQSINSWITAPILMNGTP